MALFGILEVYILVETIFIAAAGAIALYLPNISGVLNDLVKYGKSANKLDKYNKYLAYLSVPKRCFTHFYIVAVACSGMWLAFAVMTDFKVVQVGDNVHHFLRFLTKPNSKVTVDATACHLTLLLLFVHCCRRFYESLFVSVYSETEMNLLHYIAGILHYVLIPLVVVAEAPGFLDRAVFAPNFSKVGFTQFLGILMFAYCNYAQHNCLNAFAMMRRNHFGNIVNYAHGIPYGGWFDYVSCPHFLFEIGIYIALFFCLNLAHSLWRYVLLFVILNQIIASQITHHWYLDRFKSQYPPHRRALIPFVL